jgi:hypothetical protein
MRARVCIGQKIPRLSFDPTVLAVPFLAAKLCRQNSRYETLQRSVKRINFVEIPGSWNSVISF